MRLDAGNVGALRGMPDVKYDFAVSADVAAAFTAAATALTDQTASRNSARTTGSTGFKGHYAQLFADNGTTQMDDLREIAAKLRSVATQIAEVDEAARQENERRRKAREWAERQANRNVLDDLHDVIFGGEDPPFESIDENSKGPSKTAEDPATKERKPLSGGGGTGGMSSATPENLRSFATSTRSLDTDLSGKPAELERQVTSFASSCSWATLDASSLISGLRNWLTLNGQDAQWADTVAAAFEAAGSNGDLSLPDAAIAQALAAAGVSEGREDLKIDPPVAYGSPPTTGYSDDPVNTATGGFLEFEMDLPFLGRSEPLSWGRSYNSLDTGGGAFGVGWSSWCEAGLVIDAESARMRLQDGRVIVFPRDGQGWARATGENLWLEATDEGGYVVTSSWGLRSTFDSSGLPRTHEDGKGVLVLTHEDGRLVRIAHESGRAIDLVRDGQGERVTALVALDGRRIVYTYDESGRLRRVHGPGVDRNYTWNAAGLLEQVIDGDGVVEVANTFDAQRRVATQRSPFGRTTRYSYLPGGVTVTSDPDGTRSNTWVHDARGRLVGIVDSDGRRQSTSYDRFGNPVSVRGRDGELTVTEYDPRGRLSRRLLPTGARLSWTWDDLDRLVSLRVLAGEDAEEAVTSFEYEGDSRNPSHVIDAEGGVTRFEWDGPLLRRTIDPTGVGVRLDHDEFGEVVAVTNSLGDVARFERDALGRVTAAVTPLGHRTTYGYDSASGALAWKREPDGGLTRWEYTPGGRLKTIVDPMGGRTEVEVGEHGKDRSTVDPLGRRLEHGYDDLGNLSKVTLPDGSSWDFAHDAMSRMTGFTDPMGGTWGLEHGPSGMVSAATDPVGVRRTVERDVNGQPTAVVDGEESVHGSYDRLGRLVAVTGPDGSSSIQRFDRLGRVVEIVDACGAVTRIDRDAAGRMVAVVHPDGTVHRYEYDACGRWCATVSTGGDRYEFHYDADSQVVGETWPTGDTVTTRFDECGRVVARREPGRGLVRVAYDKCGRIVRMTDGFNGPRRFVYDEAGQMVQAINAFGGVTRFEYDDLGHQVAVIDPMGGRLTRTFDSAGRMTSQTDALGRTTTHTFDKAGRPTSTVDASGRRTSFEWADGRLVTTIVDGRVVQRISHDASERRATVTDASGQVVELRTDPMGRLVSRTRDGVGVHYTYDSSGRRTSMRGPDGSVTTYEYDRNGFVTRMSHPTTGEITFERDPFGRITRLGAQGIRAEYTYTGAGLASSVINRGGLIQRSYVERDEFDRIHVQTIDGLSVRHSFDEAGQLVSSVSSEGSSIFYEWDEGGRLTRETRDGAATVRTYDAAGQLRSSVTPDGTRTSYTYDRVGRRVSERSGAQERRFSWDHRGFLSGVTVMWHSGDSPVVARTDLAVDGGGELSRVGREDVYWDSGAPLPTLVQFGQNVVVDALAATSVHGPAARGAAWLVPEFGESLATGNPVPAGVGPETSAAAGVGAAHPGLTPSISASATPSIGDMDWMTYRVMDRTTQSFLSPDPVRPVLGSSWVGNPYSWAGNNPAVAFDPLGLSPVSEAELKAYAAQNNGMLANAWNAASSWVKDNWEYIAAGVVIVAGVAVMCTGVGGPIGAAMIGGALMGGGISIGTQKYQNGSVDWGKVATDAAIGGISGLAGGGAGALVTRATSGVGSCLGRNILTGVGENIVEGAVSNTLDYVTGPGPITLSGMAGAAGSGVVQDGLMGAGGGVLNKFTGASGIGCFTAGTEVLLGDGTTKPIESVEVGDMVATVDPASGQDLVAPVEQVHVLEDVDTLVVSTEVGQVETTAAHPFYVQGRGFVAAGELREGDLLRQPGGELVGVVSVEATGRKETVHNLTVAGTHTYHVRTSGGVDVLVHNRCDVPPGTTPDLPQNPNLREMAEQIRLNAESFFPRVRRTIAVGMDSKGGLWAGSSNGFDRGQAAMCDKLGIEIVPTMNGKHAEEELLNGVPDLVAVGTSNRMPCGPAEHDCAGQLADKGIQVVEP
ncbi:hypothetical protein I6B53_08240 [Schaalia sp. 19OD2882]|uniref:DUF6531 domain-containing protein n=1 Tax=Schaalia sp. 19OD2882 TaxID=2794089 RepID=UPI001C1F1D20|nr:DUF6531 domain-containing protein [Schaalia sp. 19OD2882]QWW19103.1 hypothetical protein I6B53_08240 [Schaalia sp. 19OD2882]